MAAMTEDQTKTDGITACRSIELRSHAKINMSLEVTGRRPDGYHDILSLMQGIDLHDKVRISECAENGTKYNLPHCTIGGVDVYLSTDADSIPADMSNLAFKGIKAVSDDLGGSSTGDLLICIDKRLPVAAGIAGGSGNAAVCMLGLNALLGNPLSLRELMAAGKAAGADVPFSVLMNAYMNADVLCGLGGLEEASPAAWIRGIGDIVDPAQTAGMYVILANPGISVSTREAYEAIDLILEQRQGGSGSRTDKTYMGKLFVNDLEKYTLMAYPEAASLKEHMMKALDAEHILMSGSGPTIAAYYSDEARARADHRLMADKCREHGAWRCWLASAF